MSLASRACVALALLAAPGVARAQEYEAVSPAALRERQADWLGRAIEVVDEVAGPLVDAELGLIGVAPRTHRAVRLAASNLRVVHPSTPPFAFLSTSPAGPVRVKGILRRAGRRGVSFAVLYADRIERSTLPPAAPGPTSSRRNEQAPTDPFARAAVLTAGPGEAPTPPRALAVIPERHVGRALRVRATLASVEQRFDETERGLGLTSATAIRFVTHEAGLACFAPKNEAMISQFLDAPDGTPLEMLGTVVEAEGRFVFVATDVRRASPRRGAARRR